MTEDYRAINSDKELARYCATDRLTDSWIECRTAAVLYLWPGKRERSE